MKHVAAIRVYECGCFVQATAAGKPDNMISLSLSHKCKQHDLEELANESRRHGEEARAVAAASRDRRPLDNPPIVEIGYIDELMLPIGWSDGGNTVMRNSAWCTLRAFEPAVFVRLPEHDLTLRYSEPKVLVQRKK